MRILELPNKYAYYLGSPSQAGGSGGGSSSTISDLVGITSLGQQVAASSLPVILPSATITALTPPAAITGFALEAGHLATIDTSTAKIPAQGQALAAGSMPVVLPVAQITTLTPPAAITNFANETGGNLASIVTNTNKIPSLGQALAAGSVPVILPSATITTLTPPSNTGYALDASLSTIDTDLKSNITLHAGTALIGKVGIDQTTPGTTNAVSVAQIGGTTIVNGGLAGSVSIGGTVGNNVAPTANPVPLAGIAVSSEPSANTATRISQLLTDLVGKLIVLPYANPENFTNGTTAAIIDTTTTSVIAAQGAGVRTYITSIIATNSHATVGTFVKITDGASTILWEGYAAAVGGGFAQSFPTPLRGTANTAVNAICVTTGANVIVSVAGYKGS